MKNFLLLVAVCLTVSFTACNQAGNSTDTTQDSTQVNMPANNDSIKTNMDTVSSVVTTDEQWSIAGFTNPPSFKQFFNTFKTWVANNNSDSIAAHIQFPLKNCPTAAAFKKDYSNLFNDLVKNSVANQDADRFFTNQNGAMTGNGELWFNEMNGKFVIIAINNKPLN